MSQPASFDQPRPGETILACKHNYKRGRVQIFVGNRGPDGKPTGLGTWVKTKQNPDGLYVRWLSLCARCHHNMTTQYLPPFSLAAREMVWERKPDEEQTQTV